ncbi:MAG: hypothetical protein CMK95_19775, partial [Pseudomonas sp.]|nr:hypothetical protein [Pseudomonas sp.]
LFDQKLFTRKLAQSGERKPSAQTAVASSALQAPAICSEPGWLWHAQLFSTSVGHITVQSAAV